MERLISNTDSGIQRRTAVDSRPVFGYDLPITGLENSYCQRSGLLRIHRRNTIPQKQIPIKDPDSIERYSRRSALTHPIPAGKESKAPAIIRNLQKKAA